MARRRCIALRISCEEPDLPKIRKVLEQTAHSLKAWQFHGGFLTIEIDPEELVEPIARGEEGCFELVLRRRLETCASTHRGLSAFPPKG